MEICPNKSFKSNPEQEKSDWELLIDRVGSEDNAWNEYILNGFDIPIFNEEQVIKEGVQELFVSNPELANAVYEALGFNNFEINNERWEKYKKLKRDIDFLANHYQGNKDETNEKYVKDFFNFLTRQISEKNLNDTSDIEYIKFKQEQIQKHSDISVNDKIIKLFDSLVDNYSDLWKYDSKNIKLLETKDVIYKNQKEDFKPTPQQKQIALQQYSQYLKTIFPDSKVKDIVYHGTDAKFDKFDKNFIKKDGVNSFGDKFYFLPKDMLHMIFKGQRIIPVLLNMKSYTDYFEQGTYETNNNIRRFEEGILEELAVNEPEQIHLLGSKQDIEGFKKFVTQPTTQSVKPGVAELFDSNPELANAVYEALGFKTKTSENEITRGIKEILPFKVIGDYSNIEEGLTGRRQYSTAIDGNNYVFDISTYSYENEDGTFQSYYDIDFTVNGSEDIIGTGFFDKSEKAKQIIQAIISQNYGNDTIRLNVEESKKGKQRLLLYKRLMNQLGYNPSEEMEYTLFYDIKTDKVNLTPQQKQQAQQLYSQYLESLNKPNTNPILQGNQTNIEEIITQLEKEGVLEIDCKGKLKAEKGLATSFVKGGKWKVIKDLKGYPTHKEGGVDLIIGKNGVIIKNGNTQFTAKHGLVIPKN